jgi:hypothetical protein
MFRGPWSDRFTGGLPVKAGVSAIERAFELAATGRYQTIPEIKLALHKEGYAHEQVEGPLLCKQLIMAMEEGRQTNQ